MMTRTSTPAQDAQARKIWLVAAIAGVLVSLLGIFMMPLFPASGHDLKTGFGGPVFAFEMAQNLQDLINVFGPIDDPLRAVRIAQMDSGNLWDYPFMLLYSVFMAAFCYAVYVSKQGLSKGRSIWLVLTIVALASGVMDAIENLILLDLTSDLEAQRNLEFLRYPVWAKFWAIMICSAAAGFHMCMQDKIAWKLLGAITILGAASIFMAFLAPDNYGYLIRSGVTASWVIMLLFAVIRVRVN